VNVRFLFAGQSNMQGFSGQAMQNLFYKTIKIVNDKFEYNFEDEPTPQPTPQATKQPKNSKDGKKNKKRGKSDTVRVRQLNKAPKKNKQEKKTKKLKEGQQRGHRAETR